MKFPDERGQHVRLAQVVLVVQSVKTGGHGADEIVPILAAIGLAKFDAGNFGHGVPFVGRFERAGQQIFFFERLWGEFWVNAGTAQKEQFFNARPMRVLEEIVLNLEVFVEELRRISVIGKNPADLGRRHTHVLRPFAFEKVVDGFAIEQVPTRHGSGPRDG